jgi:hypothetical protein
MLGDRVATLAEPVKRLFKKLGWWPKDCGCQARRRWLNQLDARIRRWWRS